MVSRGRGAPSSIVSNGGGGGDGDAAVRGGWWQSAGRKGSCWVIVYNLFPLLAGTFQNWRPHYERVKLLGFDWVFLNPIQRPGMSGSLYSIKDHFAINPLLVDSDSPLSGVEQARQTICDAHAAGLKVMVDLVVNHTAIDCEHTRTHPQWYVRQGGEIQHPFCLEAGDRKVVWGDLAEFDYENTTDPEGLFGFISEVTRFLLGLGVDGFRCDAAYQLPKEVWVRLMKTIRASRPDVIFVGETLGCTPEETLATARAGFDYIFNSSKWWDFESEWLLQQYELTRRIAPSIGFPESHDTARLFEESGGSEAAMKQRYLFTALFSTGVMLPMGFEFGFRRRLNVVTTRASDWEAPAIDLGPFIQAVNRVKREHSVFNEEGEVKTLPKGSVDLLVLHKSAAEGRAKAVIVLNKDLRHRRVFQVASMAELFGEDSLAVQCVSPENPLPSVNSPFHYELRPGEAIVLVADR